MKLKKSLLLATFHALLFALLITATSCATQHRQKTENVPIPLHPKRRRHFSGKRNIQIDTMKRTLIFTDSTHYGMLARKMNVARLLGFDFGVGEINSKSGHLEVVEKRQQLYLVFGVCSEYKQSQSYNMKRHSICRRFNSHTEIQSFLSDLVLFEPGHSAKTTAVTVKISDLPLFKEYELSNIF